MRMLAEERQRLRDLTLGAWKATDKYSVLDALDSLEALFDLQWKRMGEAVALWRTEDPEGRKLISPDLGALLTWLMDNLAKAKDDLSGCQDLLDDRREAVKEVAAQRDKYWEDLGFERNVVQTELKIRGELEVENDRLREFAEKVIETAVIMKGDIDQANPDWCTWCEHWTNEHKSDCLIKEAEALTNDNDTENE